MSTLYPPKPEFLQEVKGMADLVETYSGYRLHERPLRFRVEGSWKSVVKILSRWREPEGLGFTVLAEDGRQYRLNYNQKDDLWEASLMTPDPRNSPPE